MGERLKTNSRHLGRKAGAILLGIGVAAGLSEHDSRAFVNYGLPAFEHEWSNNEHEILASVELDQNAVGFSTLNRALPDPYVMALNNSLRNPIVSVAIREGHVDDVIVHTSPSDNGNWDRSKKDVNLLVSSGHSPLDQRLYSDSRAFKAVVVHEFAHGINEKWYRYMRGDLLGPLPPDDIAEDLSEIRQATLALKDELYINLPELCGVTVGNSQSGCADEDKRKLQEYAEESYRCIDEGHALQDLLNRDEPLPIGHGFTNEFEVASSLITSIEMNPSYIPDCFEKDQSKLSLALQELSRRVLRICFKSSPQLEQVMRRTPEKSEAIDKLIA